MNHDPMRVLKPFFDTIMRELMLQDVVRWQTWWHGEQYLPCADAIITLTNGADVRIAFVRYNDTSEYRETLKAEITKECRQS